MDVSPRHKSNRAYYDSFSAGYEARRGENAPGGYHDLLDTLESEFVRRYGAGGDVLEVGCGTGLVLERIREFARSARGVDISPKMLGRARERGLDVQEASATSLPFADATFDVSCSFKVLAHVPQIELALSEMARVTRTGGHVIAEFYNPLSLRGLVRRLAPPGRVAPGVHEGHVFTRFDSPLRVRRLVPAGCKLVSSRGVRIVTPTAHIMDVPIMRYLFRAAEHALCDSPLRVFGGFWVVAMQKTGATG